MSRKVKGEWFAQLSTLRLGPSGRTVCFQENWLVTDQDFQDVPTIGTNTRQRRLRLNTANLAHQYFEANDLEGLAGYLGLNVITNRAPMGDSNEGNQ